LNAIVVTTGARHGMSLLSAITSKGHMRFMIKGKGGVNSDVFIEFLKRFLVGARRPVFLIVDRGPAHISKKTKAFVATLGSRPKLFYLPAYSPDRNPDELVWKHLKADTVQIPAHRGQSFRRIADSNPVIADSF
jgi:transposase